MEIYNIEIHKNQYHNGLIVITVSTAGGMQHEFIEPSSIYQIIARPGGLTFRYKSGDYTVFRFDDTDNKLFDRVAGLMEYAIGPGAGLKMKEKYSRLKANQKE